MSGGWRTKDRRSEAVVSPVRTPTLGSMNDSHAPLGRVELLGLSEGLRQALADEAPVEATLAPEIEQRRADACFGGSVRAHRVLMLPREVESEDCVFSHRCVCE
jgi:hypothetical protein